MYERKYTLDRQTDRRNYGIDLLRIVSMLMVVILHVLQHGGLLEATEGFPFKNEVLWFIEILALCAVNCYALISGYVGVFEKFRYSNLIVLWLRVAFYSVLISLLFVIFMPNTSLNIKGYIVCFIRALFPVLFNKYWYFTCYFLLFLFMPILNFALNSISKSIMKISLLTILLFTSVIAPIANVFSDNLFGLGNGYTTIWLMVLYLLGGYIRKYGVLENVRNVWLIIAYFVIAFMVLLSRLMICITTNRFLGEIKYEEMWTSYISITILAESVCLLLLFKRIHFSKFFTKVIAFLSPLAFSVYLIHDNPIVREYLIADRFISIAGLNPLLMVLAIFGSVLAIFIICIIIDYFRYLLFKVIKVKQRLNSLENRIRKRLIKE